MAANKSFLIIKADNSNEIVSQKKLEEMKHLGLIKKDDKIFPVDDNSENKEIKQQKTSTTLDKPTSEELSFDNISDSELNFAFSDASSSNFVQLTANQEIKDDNKSIPTVKTQHSSVVKKKKPATTTLTKSIKQPAQNLGKIITKKAKPNNNIAPETAKFNQEGVSFLLLELSKRVFTGYVAISGGNTNCQLSIVAGNLHKIESQNTATINQLFQLKEGYALINADNEAKKCHNEFNCSMFSLCRKMVTQTNNYDIKRLKTISGNIYDEIIISSESFHKIRISELSDSEYKLLSLAKTSNTIGELHDNFKEIDYQFYKNLFLFKAAGLMDTKAVLNKDIEHLMKVLFSNNLSTMLGVNIKTSDQDLVQTVALLGEDIESALAHIGKDHPLHQKITARYGELKKILSSALERFILINQIRLQDKNKSKKEIRTQLENKYYRNTIKQLIFNKEYDAALAMVNEFSIKFNPKDTEFLSAKYLSGAIAEGTLKKRKENFNSLVRLAEANNSSVDVQFALAAAAKYHHKLKFIHQAEQAVIAASSANDKRAIAIKQNHIKQEQQFLRSFGAIAFSLLVVALLWILSIDLGFGINEHHHEIKSNFWLPRSLLLFISAFVGYSIINQCSPVKFLESLKKTCTFKQTILVIFIGIVVGFLSSIPEFSTIKVSKYSAFTVLIWIFCERAFFSGFLTDAIIKGYLSRWVPVLISSCIYSIYLLTYYHLYHLHLEVFFIQTLAFFLLFSLPMAIFQVISNSFIAPFLFQLVNFITFLLLAHIGGFNLSF